MNKKNLLKMTLFATPLAILPVTLISACATSTDTPQPTGAQTVAKTNLDAKTLGLTGTVADAITTINAEWIFENKSSLLDGSTSLFTTAADVVENSIIIKHKSDQEQTVATLEFALKTAKAFDQNQKPTQQPTTFKYEISGFNAPKNVDLEKAKEKLIYFFKQLRTDMTRKKPSGFVNELNSLEAIGVTNLYGFKVSVQLDKTKNQNGYNDDLGDLYLSITLTRGAKETETFSYTINDFLKTEQEKAEKEDTNLSSKVFDESFSDQQPTNVIKVKTKDSKADLKKVTTQTELLKLIDISPTTKDQTKNENAILKQALPDGYELKFLDGSIKQKENWTAPENEIEADVQIVKTDGSKSSGIYKLIVNGFDPLEKDVNYLNKLVDLFIAKESPVKGSENNYSSQKASEITDISKLKSAINLTPNNGVSDLIAAGAEFKLDENFQPKEQNDQTGSLKAKFIFSWKNQGGTKEAIKVEKEITLYGFKLDS